MVQILVNRPYRQPQMTMHTSDGLWSAMYGTPSQYSFESVPVFGTIDREGRKAITRMTGPGLRQLSFSHLVASMDYTRDCEARIGQFTSTVERGARVRFVGASAMEQAGWWVVKGLSVDVEQRALNNKPSRARLSWTLEEYVDTGAALIKRLPVPKVVPAKPVTPVYRTHRVVSGDTLWDIARKYLGNGVRWPEIYRLNTAIIKNPHWIYPGQVFKIPG